MEIIPLFFDDLCLFRGKLQSKKENKYVSARKKKMGERDMNNQIL